MPLQCQSFEDETALLSRCSQGDRRAFDALWGSYRTRISSYIRLRVGAAEDAEDLAQEAFIRAWLALSRGTAVEAFAPWLYRIAQNLVNDWFSKSKGASADPLEDHSERPASGPSVSQAVAQKLSFEFLLTQLDEVLFTPRTASDHTGTLRKLAFLHFHADQLSVPEIQVELAVFAKAVGVPVPTLATLNNWLSRGDILCSLITHLVQQHPDTIASYTSDCLPRMGLSDRDLEIASMRWEQALSLEVIAERKRIPIASVARTIGELSRRLATEVAARVKPALHEARKLA